MDNRVVDVLSYAIENNIERHLYVEHNIKDINVKVVEVHCIKLAEGTKLSEGEEESVGSDDDAKKVRFDDTEDERTTALDDGFEVIEVERPEDGTNMVGIKGKLSRIKFCANKSPKEKLIPNKKKLKLVAPAMICKLHKTKVS